MTKASAVPAGTVARMVCGCRVTRDTIKTWWQILAPCRYAGTRCVFAGLFRQHRIAWLPPEQPMFVMDTLAIALEERFA